MAYSSVRATLGGRDVRKVRRQTSTPATTSVRATLGGKDVRRTDRYVDHTKGIRSAAQSFVDTHIDFNTEPGLPELKPSAAEGIVRASEVVAHQTQRATLPKLKEVERKLHTTDLKSQVRESATSLRETTGMKFKLPKLPDKPKKLEGVKQRIDKAQTKVAREINRQSELGNITHPKMPHDLGAIVGDLIPDQPGEIAIAPVGGPIFRGGLKGASEGLAAGRAALAAEKGAVTAAKEAAKATKTGRTIKTLRDLSRSKKGRAIKAGGGVGLGVAGAASGTLLPAVEGTVKGTVEHPLGTAKTTARGLASIPAAGIAATSAGLMAGHRLLERGSKPGKKGSLGYAVSPVTEFAKANYKEAKKELETYTSKDPERIAKATAEDYGLLPAFGAIGIGRHFVTPALRHGAAAAKGTELAKGEAAPPVFKRHEDRTSVRVKNQAARAMGEEGRIKHRLGQQAAKESRRLNTMFNPDKRTKTGRKLHAISTSPTRSKISREVGRFAKETNSKFTLDNLANMAAENPLFNFKSAEEARTRAKEGLAHSKEGTAEHLGYQAIARVPELYDEPQFRRTVEAKRAALGGVERSEDVRYFPVYEEEAKRLSTPKRPVEPPPRPSEAVPLAARPLTEATTREGAVGRGTGETYRASEIASERRELRAELKKKTPDQKKVSVLRDRIAAKNETMGPVKLTAEERRAAIASVSNGDVAEKRAALQLVQEEKRGARDAAVLPELQQEFAQGAENILAKYGKEGERPTYFPHTDEERQMAPSPAPPYQRAGATKDKARLLGAGSIQSRGAVDYGAHRFAAAISGGARRQAQEGFGGWLRQAITQEHDLGRGPQRSFTKTQLGRMVEDGTVDPGNTYRVHTAFFDDPERIRESDLNAVEGAGNAEARQSQLEQKAQEIEREGGGDSYYIVDKKHMDDYLASQKIMGKWGQRLQKLGIAESRALLATSFAWMTAQLVAEGGLLMGTQSPYRLAKGLPAVLRIRKEGGLDAQHLALISDTSLGTDPIYGRMGAKSYQDGVSKGFDVARQLPIDNYMKKLVTFEYPGEWDRAKGGFLRDWYTVSEMDRQFNSRARNWARGIGETWTAIDDISHKMKGLTPEEQLTFLRSPAGEAATEAFQTSVDRAMGNWTAMSPAERTASHVLIFYPFLRFSLDWALRTYPADHPVRYTIATQMGQWNAEQLETFLTKKPGFFTDWLQSPVYGGGEGHPTGFVSFSRVAPGSNALVEALGSGRGLWGSLLGMSRPTISTLFRGVTKYNQFGEYDPKQSIPEAFANAGIGLTFPGRALKQYFDPSQGPGKPGRKEYAIRSGIFPFYPEDYPSAKKQATQDELWQKVSEGTKQSESNADRYQELGTKYSDWRSEDEKIFGPVNEPKDIKRYVKDVGPVNRKDYEEYLNIYLDHRNGRKQVEQSKRRLTKLYGESGAKLTPSLKTYYHDQIDTGRQGPKQQRELKGVSFTKPQTPALKRQAKLEQGQKPVSVAKAAADGEKNIKTAATVDAPPEYQKAIQKWGSHLDRVAKRYGITGQELLTKTLKGESNFSMQAVSSAGARGAAQFMPGTRDTFVQQYGVDPYAGPGQAVKAMAFHLDGKHGHPAGLEGYNPGGGQGYVDYILGQEAGGRRTSVNFTGKAPPALKRSFNRAVRLADNLDKAEIPYGASSHVPGLSPTIREATSHDCSSAVSWLLQKMGVKIPVLVSGQLATTPALKNGPGAITVYANDGHTFLRIGNRYWGTSGSNPGHGPGWIDSSVMTPSYLSQFTARHVPGFGPKQAKQLGAKLVGGSSGGGTGGSAVGGGSAGGGAASGGGSGGGGRSSTFRAIDYSKLSAIPTPTGILPSIGKGLPALKLPEIPVARAPRKKVRLPIGGIR